MHSMLTTFGVKREQISTAPGPQLHSGQPYSKALVCLGCPRSHWLIGAEMLHTLPHRHEPDLLLKEANFYRNGPPRWKIDWTNSTPTPPLRVSKENFVTAPMNLY